MDHHDHGDIISRADAIEHVRSLRETALGGLATERVPVDAVAGRVLAEALEAPGDVPAHDHATMDGFAFDATDAYPVTLVGEVFPEDDPPDVEPGQAVRIATGAPLPASANAVLKREEATVEGDQLRGAAIDPGTYTYERGSNVRAGERLFARGERLSPKDAILLRDIGFEDVEVRERFSVATLATGTEIDEGRTADLDSPMLAGLARSWGHDATHGGTVSDEYDLVESRIERLARANDVLLTTGGTSVGDKDYVVRALGELGDVRFHRVAVRPGKPIAGARLADQDATVFAIPGKPLGAHTITTLVARPFFTGETALASVTATLERSVSFPTAGFEYAVPVVLDGDRAMPLGHRDSPLSVYDETFDPSVLSSSTRATRADGFVLTDTDLERGTAVDVVPFPVVE